MTAPSVVADSSGLTGPIIPAFSRFFWVPIIAWGSVSRDMRYRPNTHPRYPAWTSGLASFANPS